MATIINGAAVNFAFTETSTDGGLTGAVSGGVTLTGKMFLQSASSKKDAKTEDITGPTGVTVSNIYYDPTSSAEIEYIPKDTTIAGSVTNTATPAIGDFLAITACVSHPDMVNSYWQVQPSPTITKSNTAAARITLSLKSVPAVTSKAS